MIDRSNTEVATLADLKEQALNLDGELLIQIKPGHVSAVLKHGEYVELWNAGAGKVTDEHITMYRHTYFSSDEFPNWR